MRSLAVRLLVLFVALLWAPAAMAQVKATLDREGEPHQEGFQYDISREDCEDDEVFNFTLPFAALPADPDRLEVWISEGSSDNCALAEERADDASTCTQVDMETSLVNTDGKTLKAKPTTQQLAAALENVDGCVDSSTSTDARDVTIYFLIITGTADDIPAEEYATWTDTAIDLLGPDPASISKATPADEAFKVELSGVDFSAGDAFSFQLYCFPPIAGDGDGSGGSSSSDGGGSAAAAKPQGGVPTGGGGGGTAGGGASAGGASAGGAGGGGGENAGGGSSTADCDPGPLVPGDPPPLANACGDAITQGNEITVTGATNNRVYAVAVAGVDEIGNPGALSEITCVTPVPVEDFFKVYNRSGGQGGCIGGCSSSGQQSAGLAVGLLLLGLVIVRRRKQALPRSGWLGLVGLLALSAPSLAEAQSSISDNNWRHKHRPEAPPADVDFAFEVRFAPYWAHVDDEPALKGATPYKDVFGDKPTFYFGLELDYTPIRIPYVGALGAGVGWGYTWNSALARLTNCPEPFGPEDEECLSSDTTTLEIMPMHASLVLRADELMRRTGVPIVPYGKFGFGWAYWKASKTSGVSQIAVNEDGSENDGPENDVFGEDVTIGLHAALGLALALNWLDTRSAGALRESTGIAHMYLMAEWMNAMLTGLGGGQMRVGTSTFVTGLAADF